MKSQLESWISYFNFNIISQSCLNLFNFTFIISNCNHLIKRFWNQFSTNQIKTYKWILASLQTPMHINPWMQMKIIVNSINFFFCFNLYTFSTQFQIWLIITAYLILNNRWNIALTALYLNEQSNQCCFVIYKRRNTCRINLMHKKTSNFRSCYIKTTFSHAFLVSCSKESSYFKTRIWLHAIHVTVNVCITFLVSNTY